MAVTTPDLLWTMAQEVVDCICAALTEESECACPCRACVVWGQPVWDQCCDGQLTVFVERVYVADNFPQTESGSILCSAPLAGDFVLQLIRCVPTVDDNGNAPSCDELSESARKLLQELYISERALICCLAAYKKKRRFTVRDARPVGPQGGCAGFEIRFSVELVDPIPVI